MKTTNSNSLLFFKYLSLTHKPYYSVYKSGNI